MALQHFAKESLSSSLVPAFSDQDIQNIAILIHCSPEVKVLTLNLHEEFVNMPGVRLEFDVSLGTVRSRRPAAN